MPEISQEELDQLNQFRSIISNLTGVVNLNIDSLTYEQKARMEAVKAMEAQKAAMNQAGSALKSFGSTIMDTTSTFGKYGSTIDQFGQAVSTASAGLGSFGKALSGMITVLTPFIKAVLDQTDAYVKGYDDLSKLGGAVGLSSKEIANLGRSAGFSSGTLHILTKNVKDFGPNLKQLGDSASQGTKAFTSFVNVGDDQLRKYRQLGFSQEALTEAQTLYAKQQAEGGGLLVKTPKELQKASLAYIDNLLVLSELTGIEVAKQQEAQSFAMAQENYNAYRFSELMRADELERTNKKAADAIRNTIREKDEAAMMAAAKMSARNATGFLEMISNKTGAVITESSAQFAMAFPGIVDVANNLNKGENQTLELIAAMAKGTKDITKQMSESFYNYGGSARDLQQIMGVDNKMRQTYLEFSKLETEEGKKQFKEQQLQAIKDLTARKAGNDELMKTKAGLESFERSARLFADKVMDKVNPFTGSITNASLALVAMGGAAGAATLALSKFALKAGGAAMAGEVAKASKGAAIAGKVGLAGAGALGVGMAAEAAQGAVGAETASGKAIGTVGRAAQGAAMLSMFGPYGMLAGGVLGAGYGIYENYLNKPSPDEIDKILSFTDKSGSKENFLKLDPDLIERVMAAAKEYNSVTGKKLTINSAFRDPEDQKRLYDETVKAGRPGIGPKGMPVAKPGTSSHNEGLAVDIQEYNDPKALEALKKAGLTQTVKNDPVHFGIPKAMFGAITDGPMTGYPVEHHGLEITAPLKADSILMKLAETTSNQMENSSSVVTNNVTEISSPQLEDLLTKLGEKMDMVVDRLGTSNDYQDKLVKYSMA